jgi:serine/threonine-protein kinase
MRHHKIGVSFLVFHALEEEERIVSNSRSSMPRVTPSDPAAKYRTIARLGSGGMADVFLAQASGLSGFSKLAVIKRPRETQSLDGEMLRMFLDEARLSAKLNHPNVINTFEVGTDASGLFIAMEFLDGQPLSRINRHVQAKGVSFPLKLRLQILRDMLTALDYAHNLCEYNREPLHIVHRDVSPQNVFVLYTGQAKLVDFGIAKAASTMSETRTGVLKGKLAYMPPEQARSEDLDARADLFSAGVILWEALVGRRLWAGQKDVDVFKSLVNDVPIVSPADFAPDSPPALVRICARALEMKRDARYQTAAELLADLEAAIAEAGLSTSTRDVGKFVEAEFGEDRSTLMSKIDAFIKRAASTDESAISLPDLAAAVESHSGSGSGGSGGARSGEREKEPSSGSTRELAPPLRSNGQRRVAAAISAVLLVCSAMASIIVWRTMRREPHIGAPADSIVAVAPPPPSDPAPSSSAVPSRDVRVELAATPSTAKIFLDDAEVANPFRGRRLTDTAIHNVRVVAPGFTTRVMRVSFAQDLSSDIALTPAPAYVSVPYRPPPKQTPPAQAKQEARAAVTETPPPPPPAQPKPPSQPGDNLQTPQRKGSPAALDTTNPWK